MSSSSIGSCNNNNKNNNKNNSNNNNSNNNNANNGHKSTNEFVSAAVTPVTDSADTTQRAILHRLSALNIHSNTQQQQQQQQPPHQQPHQQQQEAERPHVRVVTREPRGSPAKQFLDNIRPLLRRQKPTHGVPRAVGADKKKKKSSRKRKRESPDSSSSSMDLGDDDDVNNSDSDVAYVPPSTRKKLLHPRRPSTRSITSSSSSSSSSSGENKNAATNASPPPPAAAAAAAAAAAEMTASQFLSKLAPPLTAVLRAVDEARLSAEEQLDRIMQFGDALSSGTTVQKQILQEHQLIHRRSAAVKKLHKQCVHMLKLCGKQLHDTIEQEQTVRNQTTATAASAEAVHNSLTMFVLGLSQVQQAITSLEGAMTSMNGVLGLCQTASYALNGAVRKLHDRQRQQSQLEQEFEQQQMELELLDQEMQPQQQQHQHMQRRHQHGDACMHTHPPPHHDPTPLLSLFLSQAINTTCPIFSSLPLSLHRLP
jgi:hypothetical protein